jgi:hypothetical protein
VRGRGYEGVCKTRAKSCGWSKWSTDACNKLACDPADGVCKRMNTGASCNDWNACTTDDKCVAQSDKSGKCIGAQKKCEGSSKCFTTLCDSYTGLCKKKRTYVKGCEYYSHARGYW